MKNWIQNFALAVDRLWFTEIDSRIYAAIRITFAIVTLINLIVLWPDRHAFFADSGMIDLQTTRDMVQGEPRFSVFYFASSELQVSVVFLISAIALVGLALGVFPRVCLIIIYLWLLSYTQRAFLIVHGWDEILRIMALLLLVSPIGKCWRLPTPFIGRAQVQQDLQPTSTRERLPRYGLVLIQLQLCVIYWQTVWLKSADVHWFNGEYISYFMLSMYSRFPDANWANWQFVSSVLTYGTLLCELTIPVLLFFKRTRWLGFVLGIGLHLGILVTSILWIFSLVMLIPYLAFLDEDNIDWIQRWIRLRLG